MKKLGGCLLAVAVLALVSNEALAGGACCAKGKAGAVVQAGGAGCAKSAGASAACAEKLAAGLPAMKYRVDGEEIGCCMTARKMAAEGKKVEYIIGDEVYSDEPKAVAALTAKYNAMIEDLMTVKMVVGEETYACPMSAKAAAAKGQTQVQYAALGQKYGCSDSAKAAVAKAKEAVEHVAVSYKVDGKVEHCPQSAAKCAKDGKAVEYVVGESSTKCPVEADLLVAKAKLEAALHAAAPVGEQHAAAQAGQSASM